MGPSCSVLSDPWVRGCLVALWFSGRRSLEVLTSLQFDAFDFQLTEFAWALQQLFYNSVFLSALFNWYLVYGCFRVGDLRCSVLEFEMISFPCFSRDSLLDSRVHQHLREAMAFKF